MSIYIAFLRGINVGGKNVIKMADLKQTLTSMGLGRVKTYIQSGNVLFESDEGEKLLGERIGQNIQAAFGHSVAVTLRTAEDLEAIVRDFPFTEAEVSEAEEASQDAESLYLALLERAPLLEDIERLSAYQSRTDQFRVMGREIYLLFHHSIRDSKLANNLHKLDVSMTVRNWKTMVKLDELARDLAATTV